jgi:hypothetical protein
MIRGVVILVVAVIAAGAVFFGIRAGDDGSGGGGGTASGSRVDVDNGGDQGEDGAGAPGGDDQTGGSTGGSGPADPARPEPVLPESSCPPDLSGCVVASGTVIYVEAVDPDGDGDAHFVTSSEEGITAPGMTIFDVRADLRPDPLPGVGDLVGGAGPVFRGSYGQEQIEVVEFHVAR